MGWVGPDPIFAEVLEGGGDEACRDNEDAEEGTQDGRE
jgi:hypothetical protein